MIFWKFLDLRLIWIQTTPTFPTNRIQMHILLLSWEKLEFSKFLDFISPWVYRKMVKKRAWKKLTPWKWGRYWSRGTHSLMMMAERTIYYFPDLRLLAHPRISSIWLCQQHNQVSCSQKLETRAKKLAKTGLPIMGQGCNTVHFSQQSPQLILIWSNDVQWEELYTHKILSSFCCKQPRKVDLPFKTYFTYK